MAGPHTCFDLWAGAASGGGQFAGYDRPVPIGSIARIKWSWFVTPENVRVLPGGTEVYIARVVIHQNHLVACPSGCSTAVCLHYNEEAIGTLDNPGQSFRVTNPDNLFVNDPTQQHYCGHVRTRPTTWGSVKALYR
jgi:hypothetical protein